jgi:hypothetical protein
VFSPAFAKFDAAWVVRYPKQGDREVLPCALGSPDVGVRHVAFARAIDHRLTEGLYRAEAL